MRTDTHWYGAGYASYIVKEPLKLQSVKFIDRCRIGRFTMSTSIQQSQADILNRLYSMKQKQLEQALLQGNPLRCQVLEAEAEAIFSALKTLR